MTLQQDPSSVSRSQSHLVDGSYSIADLVDLGRLRAVFEKFSRATGCTIGLVSFPQQEILIATGWRPVCTAFHRADPRSAEICRRSNVAMTTKATREGVVVIEPCAHGLVDGGVPVIINGRRLATLATGQVFFHPPDVERFKRQAQLFGYDQERYLAAVRDVPVVDEQQFHATLSFLSDLASFIAQLGYAGLEMRHRADALAQQIAERQRAEAAGQRLMRELRAISECNQVLVRATDEQTLLDEVAGIIVRIAGYRMAWVGLAEPDERKTVRPVAWAGHVEGYLEHAGITWDESPRGHGPTGTAIRTGQVQVVHDTAADPAFEPWRAMAVQRGYRSVIVLPLMHLGRAFGSVNIYSAAPADFNADEVRMLTELAGDLAYGLIALRTRSAHALAEAELTRYRQRLEELVAERTRQLNDANIRLQAQIDEHARTEHELRRSHEQLKAAQLRIIDAAKMESVGTLAAGVAHEVKNPLAIILMAVEVLAQRLPQLDPALLPVLDNIRNAVQRGDRIIRGLLDYAAASRLALRPRSLNHILVQALQLVRPQLVLHHIDTIEDLQPDLPLVQVDPQKMEQVFVNVFVNALQAMPAGGTVRIHSYQLRWKTADPDLPTRGTRNFAPGESLVAVDICDSGPGVPEDALARIFDPFFTTKAPGQGTGLGLPVTKTIVELHGGSIDLRNDPHGGVRVTVYLKVPQGESHEEGTTHPNSCS